MPIELTAAAEEQELVDDAGENLLTEAGQLTLEAETLARFIDTIDFSPLFEDADVAQFIGEEEHPVYEDEFGRLVPMLDEGDNGEAEVEGVMLFQTLPGEIAVEFLDEADLSAMLEYYLQHEHPNATLEDRTALSLFGDVLAESVEELNEWQKGKTPFKKGGFRKGVFQGVSAKSKGQQGKVYHQRVRMMSAMMKKGVIKRVKAGTGYKGGDYTRGPGYPSGTAAGKSKYQQMSKAMHRNPGKISQYVDPGRRKVVQTIYQNLGAQMPKNWIPPERRHVSTPTLAKKKIGIAGDKAKKAAAVSKAKEIFKAKGAAVPGKAKGKAAALEGTNLSYEVSEGASLAGAMLNVSGHARQQRLITEAQKPREAVLTD